MQPDNPNVLPLEKNKAIFVNRIAPAFFSHAAHLKMPKLHAVGSQPGAGKSALIKAIAGELEKQFGKDAVVSIIGDDFRSFHPQYGKLLEIDASLAAYYTDTDSGRWVEQAIELTAQQGNCIIIEGTLRNPETTTRTVSHYLKHGFAAHLYVPAVHEFVSRTRIFSRYFDQIECTGQGRYTLPEAHDRSYKVLPESVVTLTESSLFKTVSLYDQDQKSILAVNLPGKHAVGEVSAVLEKYSDNKHVNIAEILLTIDSLLPKAKGHGRIDTDLQELRKTVSSCGI